MKYSKTISPNSNSVDYFMQVKPDEWLRVTLYNTHAGACIEDELFGGEIEIDERQFKMAYLKASNHFRLLMETSTETVTTKTNGVFTEQIIEPKKD